ncbi:MAG: hypothetical protein II278_00535 [Bacteroidaceae bacterium]|nr:hypothetical protein [Bacteroidaceae bacterium]
MKHYVVISEWANDSNCEYGVSVIGVAHTIEEAKEIFNRQVGGEREYSNSCGYDIYEDGDDVFDAGRDGYYNVDHVKLYIQEVG